MRPSNEQTSPANSARRGDARRELKRDVDRFERREPEGSFWQSLAVLGTVGWSLALPTSLGAWAGHALDRRLETGVRFTLMFLVLGLVVGGVAAWRAIAERSALSRGARLRADRSEQESCPDD